ncbi:MAG TPA: CHAT domain-containing protein, partial [Thermoanaerobaculia bacterium]|nr:CHAT domain-containing protein [Thermoanaerobaculia bacterium]
LPIRQELKDRRGEGNTRRRLGQAQEMLGNRAAAMESYQQALDIAREIGDRTGEALAVGLLAQGHRNAGDLDKALELFQESARLQLELENRAGLAFARQRIGEIEARRENLDEALKILLEVRDLRRLLEDPTAQAETLTALATVERQRGRPGKALEYAEEAIGLVESVRASVAEPAFRASFLASRRLAFDLALGLSMDLGRVEHALALSERARARSLLDMLEESRTEIREGISPALREKEQRLAYRFGVNARKLRMATKDEDRKTLRSELNDLLTEADQLEDEKRRSNPRYAVLNRRSLDADGIRALLEPDTVLLEFALGEERSFLWLVTPRKVESFELPARTVIEAAARRSYEDVRSLEKQDPEAHTALSKLLFEKVADRLHGRRLVIVPDGALHYIPFAALPDPQDPSVPLVVGHEIVSLPSASVLDVQRRVLARPAPAPKAIALLGDPVFTGSDDRLPKAVPGAPPVQPAPWGRLPATGREGKAIAKLLPPEQVFLALGPKASRATALSGELANYRVVHFATHGMIESDVPRGSFLALSILDENRQPVEGSLGLSDIYNLKLQADLVVLSGCETALGQEIRGEGLMGLTQGFLYAGAERAMASLWRVEDRATAELMIRFYGALFQEKLPPAAALRAAQLSVRRDPARQDPFYWAPFVLQGDWR